MKKHGIINSSIAKILADLGHTDQICIGDCGLPVPSGVKKIDLAIKLGSPSFQDVLEVILEDMKVERAILANEIKDINPRQEDETIKKLDKDVNIEYISHEELKKLTVSSKVIIRTGEASPYSNIILESGVIF